MRKLLSLCLASSLLSGSLLAGCAGTQSASYLVTVRDRTAGTAVEGATVEVRAGSGEVAEAGARSMTDGRGEAVLLLGGRPRADLFVTFDGETERYWFVPARIPRFDAPREEIEGDRSPVHYITGPSGTPAWQVTVVRVLERVR